MSIALAGNLFEDTIFYCNEATLGNSHTAIKTEKSFGGIHNMQKWFSKKGESVRMFETEQKASAFILVENQRKTSFVDWGSSVSYDGQAIIKWYEYLKKYPSIIHFAYIDSLPNLKIEVLQKLKKEGTKLSCDFCQSDFKIDLDLEEKLKLFDYIFSSDNEQSDVTLNRINPEAWIFYHTPYSSIFRNKTYELKIKTREVLKKPSHLVGAGDIFASNIINELYDRNFDARIYDMQEIIEGSHLECFNFVKENSK